jgi:hypothetical protein
MLSRFRRPKADISLEVSDEPYWPGDKVDVRVSLLPRDSFYVREGRIELVCIETYYLHFSEGEPIKRKRELSRTEAPFLSETRVVEGLPCGGRGIISVPPEAPPTIKGDIAEISWQVRAAVDVAGTRDIHQSRDITVLCQAPAPSPPGAAEETFDQCTLSLSLSSTTVGEGETLQGRFRVRLRQDLSVQGIRVELACQEKAKDKEVTTVKDLMLLKNQEVLAAGQVLEWPLRLHVPRHRLPSTKVHTTLVTWRVKGILDRSMREDLQVEQLITVYAAS